MVVMVRAAAPVNGAVELREDWAQLANIIYFRVVTRLFLMLNEMVWCSLGTTGSQSQSRVTRFRTEIADSATTLDGRRYCLSLLSLPTVPRRFFNGFLSALVFVVLLSFVSFLSSLNISKIFLGRAGQSALADETQQDKPLKRIIEEVEDAEGVQIPYLTGYKVLRAGEVVKRSAPCKICLLEENKSFRDFNEISVETNYHCKQALVSRPVGADSFEYSCPPPRTFKSGHNLEDVGPGPFHIWEKETEEERAREPGTFEHRLATAALSARVGVEDRESFTGSTRRIVYVVEDNASPHSAQDIVAEYKLSASYLTPQTSIESSLSETAIRDRVKDAWYNMPQAQVDIECERFRSKLEKCVEQHRDNCFYG
ncbi:uncharacterized protein BDR25DRAFT_350980 [Lindgomyces ingoldianus]|uniref:Uncharacterized protein n=1 Tax=Lindgomyces ingoldianus TaxID=673940 RepID=A0ACB6RAW5_9PLEO|nr:uncharacterized protein BDR25DRAFT_350980 [Lindgomyces ingoldianus]KAF2475611.1 hypothetical protein BDR25DRAFT_350980 [Lindgomyces ingoldianus]